MKRDVFQKRKIIFNSHENFQKVFQVFRGVTPKICIKEIYLLWAAMARKHPLKVCGVCEMTDLDQVR